MPMQSNSKVEYANLIENGNVLWTSPTRSTIFTVSPNPCINPGDHKNPVAVSYSKKVTLHATGTMSRAYYGNGEVRRSDLSGPGATAGTAAYFLAEASDPYNKALSKLVGQIKDSDLNLSTSVGEGRETLEMIGSVAKSAVKLKRRLVAALTSGKPGQRIRDILKDGVLSLNDLKAIGGGWLYFSLGVKPLLADIEALRSHVLSDKAEKVEFKVKARSSEFDEVSESKPWNYYSPPYWSATQHLHCTDSRRCELGITVSINNLHAYENWRAGIGLRPTLAWELLTLSFLADYFVKIGEWLELMEAALCNNGIAFVGGYQTETRLSESLYTTEFRLVQGLGTFPYTEGATLYHFGRADGGERLLTKKRSLLSSFPLPRSPRLTIPRASTQLLNVAALLAQTLSRGKS